MSLASWLQSLITGTSLRIGDPRMTNGDFGDACLNGDICFAEGLMVDGVLRGDIEGFAGDHA